MNVSLESLCWACFTLHIEMLSGFCVSRKKQSVKHVKSILQILEDLIVDIKLIIFTFDDILYIGPEIFSMGKNNGELRLLSGFDHETAQTYSITLHATSGTVTVDQVITHHLHVYYYYTFKHNSKLTTQNRYAAINKTGRKFFKMCTSCFTPIKTCEVHYEMMYTIVK